MRGSKWILVLLFFMVGVGQAAEMSVQFGGMPWSLRQGATLGTSLLFPDVLTNFLTPELTLAYWTIGESRVVYDSEPIPGEYQPPYFHWYHPYDGPWGAVATGVRLNIENAWPLLPKYFACGAGITQLAAWKTDDAVHDNIYGVMNAMGFLRIQAPVHRPSPFLEIEVQTKLFGQHDFPDLMGAVKLGFRFGV